MPGKHHKSKMLRRDLPGISLLLAAIALAGCGGHVKIVKTVPSAARPVVLDGTREELLDKYNATAREVNIIRVMHQRMDVRSYFD